MPGSPTRARDDGPDMNTTARPTPRIVAAVATLAAMALPLLGCGGDSSEASAAADPPPSTTSAPSTTSSTTTSTTTTTTSTTTSTSTTTTTTEPLVTLPAQPPEPIAPPADVYGDEPLITLGYIEIPAIDVASVLYQGIRLTTLDIGPGYWPGTALPGEEGNMVIAGHRTAHNRVFRDIDRLVEGDEIIVSTIDGGRHVYAVTEIKVIEPTDVWIVDPTPYGRATLFACHPPGSVRQRIVAFADLVSTA